MRWTNVAVWLASVLMVFLAGCDAEKDAVLAQYKAGEAAIAAKNAVEYRSTLTTKSIQHYQELLRLAREGQAKEVRDLPAAHIEHVLALRNRVKHDKLKAMTVDEYIAWMMDQEYLLVDEEIGLKPYGVTISGDRAMMQYGIESAKKERSTRFTRRGLISSALSGGAKLEAIPGAYVYFDKLNGYWYHDATMLDEDYERDMRDEAAEAKKPLPDYMALLEKEAYGTLIPSIWSPPK
ncbi:MAG: hypothetical protein JNL50_04730 [Phycisphaerae bacterium]|nr:hypothetical protein [Phycisphaerae bacterium]